MIPPYAEIAAIVFSVGILFLMALLEAALIEASPVALRMSLERMNGKAPSLLAVVVENKTSLFVPLQLGIQVALIAAAILVTRASMNLWPGWGIAYGFGLTVCISVCLRQLFPRLLTQRDAEKKLILLLRFLHPILSLLRFVSLPLAGILSFFKRLSQENEAPVAPVGTETSEQEIQAYLEIGEDEGILEKEDARLIQSVVEFGDTLVRAVMTPRTRIAACGEHATLAELRDVMVASRHSRIPIYRGDIDHIIGFAYIRQLLAYYSQGRESEPITGLIHPALFVPETKPVSGLLKELQARGDHAAMVVDEFGGVAGLVTIEDLVEEIVGEIRDEDQAKVSEIVEEGPGIFVLRGGAELDQLEELAGITFSNHDASTVAGLVASYLGRIPAPGEEFDLDGVRFRILASDRRRIHRLRVQLPS